VAFYLVVTGALILWLRPYAPPRKAPSLGELERPITTEVQG